MRFGPHLASLLLVLVLIDLANPANASSAAIGPGAYAALNITVQMPWNVTPGTVWRGGAVASEVSNVTITGGAVVEVGVTKQFTATALQAPPNYKLYAAVVIAITIGAAGGTIYYFKTTKRSAGRRKK